VLVLAAACGPLPKPFKPGMKDRDNPLLKLDNPSGLVVAPVEDAPPQLAGPLAEKMADGLRRREIAATTDGALNRAYLMEGRMRFENFDGVLVDLVIAWRLTDREDKSLGALESRSRVVLRDWMAEIDPVMQGIVEATAPKVVYLLRGDAPRAVRSGRAGILIAGVEGAPGDGNTALPRAFRAVLERAGIALADDPETALARLEGKVSVVPAGKRDRVAITWTLRDGDGKEIGVMHQENEVPGGRLDTLWGGLAYDIATAMADGVAAAMRRIESDDPSRPPRRAGRR
jgi:hypothetical protein